MMPALVVVGDALLDRDLDGRAERLAPDAPVPVVDDPAEYVRPGGAALAATLASLLDGREVALVTALADDEAGVVLRELLGLAGVAFLDLGLAGATAEKIRVRASGQPLLRLDRGSRPGRVGPLGERGRRAIAGATAVLVATTAVVWPPSRACGPRLLPCPPGSRWSGTPIQGARPRSPTPVWPPRTGPRRPGSSPRCPAPAWPR